MRCVSIKTLDGKQSPELSPRSRNHRTVLLLLPLGTGQSTSFRSLHLEFLMQELGSKGLAGASTLTMAGSELVRAGHSQVANVDSESGFSPAGEAP